MSTNIAKLLRRRVTRTTMLVQRWGGSIVIKAVTYCAEYGKDRQDFAKYSRVGEPAATVNMVGGPEYKQFADRLREKLQKGIVAVSEPEITVTPIH